MLVPSLCFLNFFSDWGEEKGNEIEHACGFKQRLKMGFEELYLYIYVLKMVVAVLLLLTCKDYSK